MKVLALLVCIMLPTYTLATGYYDIKIKGCWTNACASYCHTSANGWNAAKNSNIVNKCRALQTDSQHDNDWQCICYLVESIYPDCGPNTCAALKSACEKDWSGSWKPIIN